MMQHKVTSITSYFILAIIATLAGCGAGGDYTGIEYMPDMKHSRAFETFSPTTVFADGKSAQLPVEGTIKRGYTPYNYANTNADYERAGQEVTSPLNSYEHKMALQEGKQLYNIYCAVCHGKTGVADGTIVKNGKYPPPPSYFREDILALPEGKMFHSVTHGKNLMGGYSSQLNQKERWKVISYIRDMQAKHIAKEEKISEAAALKRLFVGTGYLSAAEEEAMANVKSKPKVDNEYAGLKSIEQELEEYQKAHGHGSHGDSHGGDHGNSYGSHGDRHGADEANHEEVHQNKDHKKNHDKDAHPENDLDTNKITEKVTDKIENVVEKVEIALATQYKTLTADTKVKRGDVFELKNIKFRSGKSEMRGSSTEDLNRLTNILNNNTKLRIKIEGHTDSSGEEEINIELSKARALAVKNYLVNTSGINADRIITSGLGSAKPIADNKTRKGKQNNRRTEVTFL